MATDNPKISVDFLKQYYPGLCKELEDEDLQSIVQQLGNAMIKTKGALQRVSREALQILVEKKDFPVFALEILKPEGRRPVDSTEEGPDRKRLKSIGAGLLGASASESGIVELPPWNRRARAEEDGIPLVMRDVYERLSNSLYQGEFGSAVVTGMPGIGKSWFVDAFSSFLLKKKCAVMLECDIQSPGMIATNVVRVELIVPRENDVGVSGAWLIHSDRPNILHHTGEIKAVLGNVPCWNLIDYRDRERKPLFDFGPEWHAKRVIFASPDRKRWEGFFSTDVDKGQENIFIMPVWSKMELEGLLEHLQDHGCRITSDDLHHLVTIFGPSPRYCLSQFYWCMLKGESTDTNSKGLGLPELAQPHSGESKQEEAALTVLKKDQAQTEKMQGPLYKHVINSDKMLEAVLSKLSDDGLKARVKRAADVMKGRIKTTGVVKELLSVIDSPTQAVCRSTLSSRLLVWGVQGDGFRSHVRQEAYATYASPYIASVVLEENSKIQLASMAKFFESGDRNVGAGSGWMYEGFILKYWLPSLSHPAAFDLAVIGTQETRPFAIPKGYQCEPFGDLQHVGFKAHVMYLPVARTLGAVDCFMVIGDLLIAIQVTTAKSHSVSKAKWESLQELAKTKGVKRFWLIFVVPHWRFDDYKKEAQKLSKGGKVIRVTGELKSDNKATCEHAIDYLERNHLAKADDIESLRGLIKARKAASTTQLRSRLKPLLAKALWDKGMQDSNLEGKSVPMLIQILESTEAKLMSDTSQLLWPVQKQDFDDYFKAANIDEDNEDGGDGKHVDEEGK